MFSRPDRLFRRYQQTGEPRLLGAAFDRTAPELLRVALHLARDRHRAEDLLQSTFLTAIEKAQTYDADRPLLPWLLAILANHSRQEHRRDRRPLPAGHKPDVGDVSETAATRELAAVCDRAIEALSEPYRHVLLLHLRNGLSGQEIAASLDRSDSTVRNQIARGLDLLRKKLPTGIAGAVIGTAAMGVASGRGLAAVRHAVMAKVPRPIVDAGALAVATGAASLGVLLMSKKILVSLLLLPLLAGGLWYSGVLATGSTMTAPDETTHAAAASSTDDLVATDTRSDAAPVRHDATVVPEAKPAVGSLHATVLLDELETPVADAAFSVWTRIDGSEHRVASEGLTEADGTATVEGLPAGEYSFRLDRFDVYDTFTIEAGTVHELRCEVGPGIRLTGIVVDPDGRPVSGAEIRSEAHWNSVLLARTAADGTFDAEHVCSARIWAVAAGRQPSKRHELDRRSTSANERFVLGAAGTRLYVRVRDEQGQPVARAYVYVGLDKQAGSSALQFERQDGRTNDAGEFAGDWVKPGHVIVAAIPADGDRDRAAMQRLEIEAGVPAQARLQLGSGASVVGVVLNDHGQPVAGAKVWESYQHHGLDPLDRHGTVTASDGSFVMLGLLAGPHWLGTERGGTRIDEQVDLVRGQQLTWNAVLADGAPIAIRVLGPDGLPLQRMRVNVLKEDGYPKLYGWTDGDGRCRFEHLEPKEHTVQILAAGLSVVVLERIFVPNAIEVIIRLDTTRLPSSRITGRIVDGDGKPVTNCDLGLHANSTFRQPQHINQDGRFTTDLLPPGTYSLSASAKSMGYGYAHASAVLTANENREVGDIVLPRTASLAINLHDRDGGAVKGAVLRLDHPRVVTPGTDYLVPDEVDGVYRKTGINPGNYVLQVFGETAAPQSVTFTLGAGERRELDVVMQPAVAVTLEIRCRLDTEQDNGMLNGLLTVTDAAGKRVVLYRLWPYFDDQPQRIKRLRIGLMPGTYQVHAKEFNGNGFDGKETDLQIEVPATPPTQPFVVDLR